jgi:ankyrin repeat protein
MSNEYGLPIAVVKWLLEEGADVNARLPYLGEFQPNELAMATPLQLAVQRGWEPLVRLLLEFGADVNAPEGPFGTALQKARETGNQEIIELLLQYGARDIPASECSQDIQTPQTVLCSRKIWR